jgi:hypothetical protein
MTNRTWICPRPGCGNICVTGDRDPRGAPQYCSRKCAQRAGATAQRKAKDRLARLFPDEYRRILDEYWAGQQ